MLPPSVTHQPPSVTHQPPSVTQQPPSVTQQPPSVTHQPPSVTHQPPSVTHQPPSVTHQPPSVTHQPPSVTHQPPSVTHQPPSVTHRHRRAYWTLRVFFFPFRHPLSPTLGAGATHGVWHTRVVSRTARQTGSLRTDVALPAVGGGDAGEWHRNGQQHAPSPSNATVFNHRSQCSSFDPEERRRRDPRAPTALTRRPSRWRRSGSNPTKSTQRSQCQ